MHRSAPKVIAVTNVSFMGKLVHAMYLVAIEAKANVYTVIAVRDFSAFMRLA